MYKYIILFVATVLSCSQCSVIDKPILTDSSTSSQVQTTVENSTDKQMSSISSVFQTIDKEINQEVQSILPFLSLFFDSLFGQPSTDDEDCTNDMMISLVPEESTTTSNGDATTEPSVSITTDKPVTSATATENSPTTPATVGDESKPDTKKPTPPAAV